MDLINQFIGRYKKEFDFYEMACRIVAQQLETRLQASGIRAIVTSRAKNPKRLASKIKQRSVEKLYTTIEEIYDDIVDLAGVRVALYFPGERDEVDKLIKDQFVLATPPKEFTGTSNPSYQKRFSGYWATHYRVQIRDASLNEAQQRYADARVEIQVASVLMHAWSEVEHDLIYKPLQGTLSEEELAILDELNGMVLVGEIALERLQKAIEVRVTKLGTPFGNHYELSSYLFEAAKPLLKGEGVEPILGEVDILYSLLRKLDIASPEDISPYISSLHSETEKRSVAQQIIDQILAAEPERYTAFAEVRKESDQGIIIDESINTAKNKAIGYFISQWICFERFIHEITILRDIDSKFMGTSTRVLKKLDLFNENLIGELEYIRRIRNNLVHGVETPDLAYITSAGQSVERIMKGLLDNTEEDVRMAVKKALSGDTLSIWKHLENERTLGISL